MRGQNINVYKVLYYKISNNLIIETNTREFAIVISLILIEAVINLKIMRYKQILSVLTKNLMG